MPATDLLLLPAPASELLAVDISGAAKLLSISPSHLFALQRAGKWGPKPIRLGRSCRFLVAALKAWLEAGCPSAAQWRPKGGRQ